MYSEKFSHAGQNGKDCSTWHTARTRISSVSHNSFETGGGEEEEELIHNELIATGVRKMPNQVPKQKHSLELIYSKNDSNDEYSAKLQEGLEGVGVQWPKLAFVMIVSSGFLQKLHS